MQYVLNLPHYKLLATPLQIGLNFEKSSRSLRDVLSNEFVVILKGIQYVTIQIVQIRTRTYFMINILLISTS